MCGKCNSSILLSERESILLDSKDSHLQPIKFGHIGQVSVQKKVVNNIWSTKLDESVINVGRKRQVAAQHSERK